MLHSLSYFDLLLTALFMNLACLTVLTGILAWMGVQARVLVMLASQAFYLLDQSDKTEFPT